MAAIFEATLRALGELPRAALVILAPGLVVLILGITEKARLTGWQDKLAYWARTLSAVAFGATVELLVHPCDVYGSAHKNQVSTLMVVVPLLLCVLLCWSCGSGACGGTWHPRRT